MTKYVIHLRAASWLHGTMQFAPGMTFKFTVIQLRVSVQVVVLAAAAAAISLPFIKSRSADGK